FFRPLPPCSTLFPYTRSSDLGGFLGFQASGLIEQRLQLAIEQRLLAAERLLLVVVLRELAGQLDLGRVGTIHLVAKRVLLLFERSEEHTSELQSRSDLVCRLL